MKYITPVLLAAAGFISPCYAGPVTPNFTSGTITSNTTTHTEVIEKIGRARLNSSHEWISRMPSSA